MLLKNGMRLMHFLENAMNYCLFTESMEFFERFIEIHCVATGSG